MDGVLIGEQLGPSYYVRADVTFERWILTTLVFSRRFSSSALLKLEIPIALALPFLKHSSIALYVST